MKIAITGTRHGIGMAIKNQAEANGHFCHGFNRNDTEMVSSWDLPYVVPNLVQEIVNYDFDVFVNNAHGLDTHVYRNAQLELFHGLLHEWAGNPKKTILNISSLAAYNATAPIRTGDPNFHRIYANHKKALDLATQQAFMDRRNVQCRVCLIRPGWVDTPSIAGPRHANVIKLDPIKVAELALWMIEQPPTIRITELTVYATDQHGYSGEPVPHENLT